MKQIRWVRRRLGWAGFVGNKKVATVKYPAARMAKNRIGMPKATMLAGPYVERYGDVEWYRPPSVPAALAWCERHYAPMPTVDLRSMPAYLVRADHKIDEVIAYAPVYQIDRLNPNYRLMLGESASTMPEQVPYTRINCPGNIWANNYQDPFLGIYGEARALIYVEPGADRDKTARLAESVLQRRAFHMGLTP